MSFEDPEMFATAIRDAHLEPCQLSNRPASSRVIRMQCPRLCLDLIKAGPAMLYGGEMARDCYTMSFVMTCPGAGHSFNFGLDFEDGYMGFFPPGGALDATNPAGSTSAILAVPVEEFHEVLAIHYPDIPNQILVKGAGVRVGARERDRLRDLLSFLGRRVTREVEPSRQLPWHDLARALLPAYVAALRSGSRTTTLRSSKRVSNRHRRLGQARDFIEAHLHQPIHLEDLCQATALSERAVENLFQDLMGIGPTAFLRHQRLHCTHRTLLQENPAPGKVKHAALEAGFWHLGHFSRGYRQLFGELPSETLSRHS